MTHHTAYGLPPSALDIVMIDASKPMQTLIRSMLSSAGVRRIRIFENADHALEAMLAEPPNLIISDWFMKPTSGYQLLRAIRLKQMDPLCFVPAIIVSGHTTRSMIESAMKAGAHHCLAKPISSSSLHRSLTWLARDEREFVLEGKSYVIGGVSELLQQHRDKSQGLENARQYYQSITHTGSVVQSTVDEILKKQADQKPAVTEDADDRQFEPLVPSRTPFAAIRSRA